MSNKKEIEMFQKNIDRILSAIFPKIKAEGKKPFLVLDSSAIFDLEEKKLTEGTCLSYLLNQSKRKYDVSTFITHGVLSEITSLNGRRSDSRNQKTNNHIISCSSIHLLKGLYRDFRDTINRIQQMQDLQGISYEPLKEDVRKASSVLFKLIELENKKNNLKPLSDNDLEVIASSYFLKNHMPVLESEPIGHFCFVFSSDGLLLKTIDFLGRSIYKSELDRIIEGDNRLRLPIHTYDDIRTIPTRELFERNSTFY